MSDDSYSSLKGSEARLWALIASRGREGADKAAIDARIWDLFGEEWAVMFTDLTGFSRQVEAFGILHFLQEIHAQQQLLFPLIESHDGILIKTEADSLLVIFRRAISAVHCAIAMQKACRKYNAHRAPEDMVLLCVGLGYGRILKIGDQDVYGREVNAASKLGEDTAKANEILVTRGVRDACEPVDGVLFESLEVRVPGSQENFSVRYDSTP
ncbi:MAG: adenylate/guanylate cyclase domain-containing protein [Deltaproteobacteria bacterium]|nr:adenylate/guanylate cyclase domain-containing protein [Deltaproteobacteria bacterium]